MKLKVQRKNIVIKINYLRMHLKIKNGKNMPQKPKNNSKYAFISKIKFQDFL